MIAAVLNAHGFNCTNVKSDHTVSLDTVSSGTCRHGADTVTLAVYRSDTTRDHHRKTFRAFIYIGPRKPPQPHIRQAIIGPSWEVWTDKEHAAAAAAALGGALR